MRKQRPSSERCMSRIYSGSMTDNWQLKHTRTDTTSNRLKLDCVSWRNNGGPTGRQSCKRQRTEKTQSFSMTALNRYTVHKQMVLHHYWVQMQNTTHRTQSHTRTVGRTHQRCANRSSTISQAAIDNIAQRPLMDELAQRRAAPNTWWNCCSNQETFQWKSSRTRCDCCRNLQVRWNKPPKEPCKGIQQYMGQQGCSARVQWRNHCPHLQKEGWQKHQW